MTNFKRLDLSVDIEIHEKFRYVMFLHKQSISEFVRDIELQVVKEYESKFGPIELSEFQAPMFVAGELVKL